MVENSSRQLYQGPSFLTDMFGYNIADHATPFGVFFAGLVTVICMVFTFLYLQKKALQSAVTARVENRTQAQTESSEEELEEQHDINQWPLDDADVSSLKKSDNLSDKEIDALNFCGHIPGEIKKATAKATQKKIEQEMTIEQREEERRLQREQLEAIFAMMADQQEKFGVKSAEDLSEQMRLYM